MTFERIEYLKSLISRLDEAGRNYRYAALIISFRNHLQYIEACVLCRAQYLRESVERGGVPIGLSHFNGGEFEVNPLDGFAGDQETCSLLGDIREELNDDYGDTFLHGPKYGCWREN